MEPEKDVINHVKNWGSELEIKQPKIIGWNFPVVSQEQVNVFHMHGYSAACVLPLGIELCDKNVEVIVQKKNQKYMAITIKEPFKAPFNIIPNAYKTLMSYMQVNGLQSKNDKDILLCFEKQYIVNGFDYMDVYIAIK